MVTCLVSSCKALQHLVVPPGVATSSQACLAANQDVFEVDRWTEWARRVFSVPVLEVTGRTYVARKMKLV